MVMYVCHQLLNFVLLKNIITMREINSKIITVFITLSLLCFTILLCIDSVERKRNLFGRSVFSIGKFSLKGCK